MKIHYPSISQFQQFVELKDYRPPTKKEYVRNVCKLAEHSCNHRACPQCGHADATQWLERQRRRLLPVPYYLVTFTVPQQLRPLIRSNQKLLYALLLQHSASTLLDVGRDHKDLGAQLGLLAVLQTWTRDLLPRGFQRVRYFGWLSSASKTNWERILALLDWNPPALTPLTPLPPPLCPSCHQPMKLFGSLSRAPPF